ncbi:MAG TPA: hypothetical protein VKZ69_04650 [Limnochordales bacterium]|nr:hypothetical protein [Limnochordales bacterium]
MKVAVRGNPQVLGNTPEEILADLLELGFHAPKAGAGMEAYVAHLEQLLAQDHGIRIPAGIAPEERAERIVLGLVEAGQLDLLED